MKQQRAFFVLITGLCASLIAYCNENPLATNFLPEQYQDIVINGQVINKGVRNCEQRYQAIKKILDRYKRPITVLDIGASQGYFSFRIAHDYDATCVMIEDGYNDTWKTGEQLLEICKLNTELNNIILLQKRLSLADLEHLGSCEHFDVVIALNIIHHFGTDWKAATDAILNLGETIIIESPSGNDSIAHDNPHIRHLENYLKDNAGTLILETTRHTDHNAKGKMYVFEKKRTFITRKYWILKASEEYKKKFLIQSDYNEKHLIKHVTQETIPWIKGINVLTFLMLHGVYPSITNIKANITSLFSDQVKDFTPWNFIIQGDTLSLIDQKNNPVPPSSLDCNASFDFTMQALSFFEHSSYGDFSLWFKEQWPLFLKKNNVPFSEGEWFFYDL